MRNGPEQGNGTVPSHYFTERNRFKCTHDIIAIKLPSLVLAFPVSKGLYIVTRWSVNISVDNTVTVSTQ